MISAYDLQADGSVRNMRVFHNFHPGRSADGLAIDVRCNLYAAASLNFLRGTSETLTNVAFGGGLSGLMWRGRGGSRLQHPDIAGGFRQRDVHGAVHDIIARGGSSRRARARTSRVEVGRAACFYGPGRPFELREFPVPEPQPGAVVLRTTMATISSGTASGTLKKVPRGCR